MENRKRQLAAIMFTDIVGYSAMMQQDEAKAAMIRKRHREVFERVTKEYGGKILQYYGDGTLSIFNSTVASVECGVALQKELRQEPKVPLRIGIHSGDITYDNDDAFGDGMNVASRIEPVCTPGGVFISSKVYDDIKNHSWLKAKSLGFFRFKNIQNELELYAVTSGGLPGTIYPEVGRKITIKKQNPESRPHTAAPREVVTKKQKSTAALIALILGTWGIHRFYLGQRKKGIWHFIGGIIAMGISAEGNFPFIIIPLLIGLMDAIILFSMGEKEFDVKYNIASPQAHSEPQQRTRPRRTVHVVSKEKETTFVKRNPHKVNGKQKFESGDFHGAISDFDKILESDPNDVAAHFNLACCYSSIKKPNKAFYHISMAVAAGFEDIDKIYEHRALEYVHSLPEFHAFAKNDFKIIPQLPSPKEDLLENLSTKGNILDQIAGLGELMERGVITEEEFQQQKQKLLRE